MCLIYSEGCYYLIAYNEKHDSFPSYRVDRMQGLRITDEAAVRNERIATFDAAAYTSRTFSMFGGETTPATLLVEESVMSAIIRPLRQGRGKRAGGCDMPAYTSPWPPAPCSSAGSPSSAPPCA